MFVDFYFTLLNWAFVGVAIGIPLYSLFGSFINKYLGYDAEVVFETDNYPRREYSLRYTKSEMNKMKNDFARSLASDFWIRRSTGDHPSINLVLEDRFELEKHDLLDNVLAYCTLRDRIHEGFYYDAIDGPDFSHLPEVTARGEIDSMLNKVRAEFEKYFRKMLHTLEETVSDSSDFVTEVESILNETYVLDEEDEEQDVQLYTGNSEAA